jgi:soluble lytic murein transglycosylase-like protein
VRFGSAVLAAALGVVLVVALTSGGGTSAAGGPKPATHPAGATAPGPGGLPAVPPSDPRSLAADLASAQRLLDRSRSSAADLESAGRFEQLATREIERRPSRLRSATLGDLSGAARASTRSNLAAADALTTLVTPQHHLPHWRIIRPPAPRALLGYFRAAHDRYRVPWEDLAAIEFVETRFGRVRGLSTAGAKGPMQFLPATWAHYGKGDINNPRDAIFGAARFLVANGGRRNIADALYHYNPSRSYVRAVDVYAGRMRGDARAFFGYYYWQVLYDWVRGTVILPQGYPRVRPIPLG